MNRLADWCRFPSIEPRPIRRFRRQIESENGHRLALGVVHERRAGWISTDLSVIDPRDHRTLGRFFHRSSVDALLAEHVWQKWTIQQGFEAAKNCFQYLKPGGCLRVAVTDGFHPSPSYLRRERVSASQDDVRSLYNYISLGQLFAEAGFRCQLIEYFDEDGSFHSNPKDVSKGLIHTRPLRDTRNEQEPYEYTSLILDALKPDAKAMGFSNGNATASGVLTPPRTPAFLPKRQDAA